jgi:hypothetical protein
MLADVQDSWRQYFDLVTAAGDGIARTDEYRPRPRGVLSWHNLQPADYTPVVQEAIMATQPLLPIVLLGQKVFG